MLYPFLFTNITLPRKPRFKFKILRFIKILCWWCKRPVPGPLLVFSFHLQLLSTQRQLSSLHIQTPFAPLKLLLQPNISGCAHHWRGWSWGGWIQGSRPFVHRFLKSWITETWSKREDMGFGGQVFLACGGRFGWEWVILVSEYSSEFVSTVKVLNLRLCFSSSFFCIRICWVCSYSAGWLALSHGNFIQYPWIFL